MNSTPERPGESDYCRSTWPNSWVLIWTAKQLTEKSHLSSLHVYKVSLQCRRQCAFHVVWYLPRHVLVDWFCMCSPVSCQVTLIWETVVTYLAFVRLCTCMSTTVLHQVSKLHKALVTGITLVRFVSWVGTNMHQKIATRRKSFLA